MPRIPEGQFRLDPSVRVGNEALPEIRPTGARELRSLGKQFGNIADELEQAELAANNMQKVEELELKFNTFSAALEADINDNSSNGMMPNPNNPDNPTPIAKYTQEKIKVWRAENEVGIKDNPELNAQYNSFMFPALSKMQNKAVATEKTQKVEFGKNILSDSEKTIEQKHLDGELTDTDIIRHQQKINSLSKVIGRKAADEFSASWKNKLALNAGNSIKNSDASDENIARQKRFVMLLPEAGRRKFMRNLEDGIKAKHKMDRAEEKEQHEFLMAEIRPDKPKSYFENQQVFGEYYSSLGRRNLSPLETSESRVDKLSDVMSKEVSAHMLFENGDDGPIVMADPQELEKRKNVRLKETRRRLASMPFFKKNPKALEQAVAKADNKIDAEIEKFRYESTEGNPLGTAINLDGSLELDLMSDNPHRVAQGVEKVNDYYVKMNVATKHRDLVDSETAKAIGETFRDNAKGGTDSEGTANNFEVKRIVDKFQDRSLQYVQDLVPNSGGTQAGKSNVPEVTIPSVYIDDHQYREDMFKAYANKEANFKAAAERQRISEEPESQATFKRSIRDAALKASRASLINDFAQENTLGARGITDMYEVQMLPFIAAGMSVKNAAAEVAKDNSNHIHIFSDGENGFVANGKFLKEKKPTEGDMIKAMQGVRSLDMLDKLGGKNHPNGVKIDFDLMIQKNKLFANQAETLSRLKKTGGYEAQLKYFKRIYGGSIVAVNDPDNFNTVKLRYKKGGKLVPVPMVVETGVVGETATDDLRVNMAQYYDVMKGAEKARRDRLRREAAGLTPKEQKKVRGFQ